VKALSCIFLLLALVMTAAAADITGKWSGTFAAIGADGKAEAPSSAYMIVKQSGTTLTGSGGPDENEQWPIQNGKIDGNKITAQVTSPDGATYALTMTVDGDRISGDVIVTGGDQNIKGKVEFKRVP
jgi:hypothetical protein